MGVRATSDFVQGSGRQGVLAALSGLFLASTLYGQGLLEPPFFTRLQVVRMPLDLFNNIFLLYFSLESSQSTFQRLAVLDDNSSQT